MSNILAGLVRKRQDCWVRKIRKAQRKIWRRVLPGWELGDLQTQKLRSATPCPAIGLGGIWGSCPASVPAAWVLAPWISSPPERVRNSGLAPEGLIQPLEGLRKAKDHGSVNSSCFWGALGFFHQYPWSRDAVKALCSPSACL